MGECFARLEADVERQSAAESLKQRLDLLAAVPPAVAALCRRGGKKSRVIAGIPQAIGG